MKHLLAIIVIHTLRSKGISLNVEFHNAQNLYSNFKMFTFNRIRNILYLRYEYFLRMHKLFELFLAESTNVCEMRN